MNTRKLPKSTNLDGDLARMIEPLANFICAHDKPRSAVAAALATLLRTVEQINASASLHVATASCGHAH